MKTNYDGERWLKSGNYMRNKGPPWFSFLTADIVKVSNLS